MVCVYYYRTYEKAVSGGGEREKGGHVLRDTTSRGLYVRVWPPHTSERRGGGGGCEQEGWQGGERERERERERALLGTISITGWSRARPADRRCVALCGLD